ncbi:hypothetical protein BP6252_09805 [Coleophoma cylindrospora]|uniref:DUF7820 domain-containing protein n=1 Tax=Coleophoma cylindrospora TaxID=1849047 RepID=A0A3D8QWU5_9HELO|nr:hypothetical protein BP6252_09805 [Coleophoma cylindrospora]
MATPKRSASIERRASMRTSMRLSRQPEEDDEFALAAMGISDGGYRPGEMTVGPQSMSSNVELPPQRRSASPPPRPSSISKPKGLDSFALRHDGQMGPIAESSIVGGSSTSQSITRSSTVSSDSGMSYVRPESPYRGPTAPSHSYQMYSQDSRLERTASVATSMAAPVVERNYTGPSGPTHPYGMYPQSTVPETDGQNVSPMAPIPVGFPGLNNNYQRRLGPDGEEIAGIIGPDGHTEELPPYTQYPDEAFARKTRPNVVVPVTGAGGMGLATRNPEFASREDLNSPQSGRSSRSFTSEASSHRVNTAAYAVSEKPPLKRWQQIARKKACGIVPVWAFVLVGVALILFGIILGATLYALKPKSNNNKKHNVHPQSSGSGNAQSAVATVTTTFDASPVTTVPTNLPTLPTGIFALPIQLPSTVQSSCMDSTAESAAWSCNLPGSPLQVDVQAIPGQDSTHSNEIEINFGNNSMPVFPYGAQPPTLTEAQVLSLVVDNQDSSKGPAWFFQTTYNKLVVLPESTLNAGMTKRDAYQYHQIQDFQRKGVAQPGDKPWFCYWNGTLLEAFLYVNLTSSAAQQAAAASSAAVTQTSTGAASTATSDPKFLAGYPKVIKIEERRVPRGSQAITPYCVQQSIDGNGIASPYVNSTGQVVTLYLNETEPTSVSPVSKRSLPVVVGERALALEARSSSSDCACVWLAT